MKTKLLKSIVACSVVCASLNATSLRDSVVQTVNTNPDIVAEHFKREANRLAISEQERDYYPTLDFATFVETSHTYAEPEDQPDYDLEKDGWDATLKFEQVLYDGGLTPNEVKQFKYRYSSIKYTSKDKVEDLIFEIVNTYTKLVSYQELIALDNLKLKTHDKYLRLAKEDEANGKEKLPVYQVSSKIKAIMDNFLEQEVSQEKAFSTYKKLTGSELNGYICRPVLDEMLIPKTVDDAIELALRNNDRIHAQKESIREQKARVNTEKAKFRPTLKLQLQAQWNNDLSLPENGQEDIYRARLQSDWNFYEGGKDSITIQKERIFILEQRKILDAIRNEVTDEIKGSYNSYYKLKERIVNLQEFIGDNKEIVKIYREQRKDGSRTFVDLLDAEAELFRTLILLNETEFLLFDEYFNILRGLNILSDSVLAQKNQQCIQYQVAPELIDSLEEKEESADDMEQRLLGGLE